MTAPDLQTTASVDGARLALSPQGAQVLSWIPASGGPDRLYLSPLAAPPVLRGGVPVVFPQFSDRGPLPKHGLVRDRPWTVVACGGGRVLATCADDVDTRRLWPHAFSLTLSAEVLAERLEIDLVVSNTGDEAFTFTAALHAYLAVPDAGRVTVDGVGGLTAQDNGGGTDATLAAGTFAVTPPVDLAVLGAHTARVLRGGAGGDLAVTTGGFTDTVLWNPGPQDLPDVPAGAQGRFFCLEPAVLTPVVLAPGGTWRGAVRFTALAAGAPADDLKDPNNA